MIFNKNDKAISPIVATLILIIVALVGAVAVGALLGMFSNNVGGQTNAGGIDNNLSMAGDLKIDGSTSCYPVVSELASMFESQYPSARVTVSGGGSGVGKNDVNNSVVDIGMASSEADATKYPDLIAHKIGGSGVVVITGTDITCTTFVTPAELLVAYAHAAPAVTPKASLPSLVFGTGTTATPYQRAETGSGTQEYFYKWIGWTDASGAAYGSTTPASATTSIAPKTGNEGVLAAVKGNPDGLGFVDWGYVDTAAKKTGINIIPVASDATPAAAQAPSDAAIKGALNGQSTYPAKLVRPLILYTKGAAKPLANSFITYCLDPTHNSAFSDAGVFSVYDLSQ